MKAFRFALESVLGWRQTQLTNEETRLAAALEERSRAARDLAGLRTLRETAEQQVRSAKSIPADELRNLAGFQVWARREEIKRAERLALCERRATEQRARVIEARRRCRVLELLKEKQRRTWNYEFGRELEALAADAYLAKWNRERRAEQALEQTGGE